jgi:hypothetical protein
MLVNHAAAADDDHHHHSLGNPEQQRKQQQQQCWLDVAVADPFLLQWSDDAMGLAESHRSGFYLWLPGEEEHWYSVGPEPLPWDIAVGQHQGSPTCSSYHCHSGTGNDGGDQAAAAAAVTPTSVLPSTPAHPEQQQQQQGQGHIRPRLLVYIHAEQLLQSVPWWPQHALAHTHLEVPRLVGGSGLSCIASHLAGHMAACGTALWLVLDVCQLHAHGSGREGCAVVPLRVHHMGMEGVKFAARTADVLVALYARSVAGVAGGSSTATASASASAAAGRTGTVAAAAAAAAGEAVAAAQLAQRTQRAAHSSGRGSAPRCELLLRGSQTMLRDEPACQLDVSGVDLSAAQHADDLLGALLGQDEVCCVTHCVTHWITHWITHCVTHCVTHCLFAYFCQ